MKVRNKRRPWRLPRPDRSFWLKAAISTLLLAFILIRFEPGDVWQSVRSAQWNHVLLAALLSPLILAIKVLRWLILGRQVARRLRPGEAAVSLLAGMGLGLVTPGRVGELARVSYLPVPEKSRFVGFVAIDRALDLATLLLAGAVAAAIALQLRAMAAAFIIPVVISLALLFVPGLPAALVARVASWRSIPWKKQIARIAAGLATLTGRVLALIFLLSLITFALGTYQFFWLLRSFYAATSPAAAAVSFPMLTVAGVLPVTVGGLGTREGASVLVLSLYHIPEAAALSATLLSFILNTLLPGVIGLLLAPAISTGGRQSEPPPLSTLSES